MKAYLFPWKALDVMIIGASCGIYGPTLHSIGLDLGVETQRTYNSFLVNSKCMIQKKNMTLIKKK